MDENWYSAEQEIRDRIARARASARVQSLIQELTPTRPRQDSVRASLIRWATRILARAPRGGAMKHTTSRVEKGHA